MENIVHKLKGKKRKGQNTKNSPSYHSNEPLKSPQNFYDLTTAENPFFPKSPIQDTTTIHETYLLNKKSDSGVNTIETYSEMIKRNPNSALAYNNRGFLRVQLGLDKEAMGDYNKAITLNPKFAEVYLNRGFLRARLGLSKEAIEDYNKAIALNPKFAEAYLNRGLLLAQLDLNKEALNDYNKAIELNSKFAEAYLNRGSLNDKLGVKEKALEDYSKAIALNPKLALAFNNRGLLRVDLGLNEEAMDDYNKAIELDSKLAEAYLNRGLLRAQLGLNKKALEDDNKAIELKPNYAVAYSNRGMLKASLKLYKEAMQDHDKAVEIDPGFANLYVNRASLKAELKLPESAIEDCDKAIKLNPKLAKAYGIRGGSKIRLGLYKEAIEDSNKAIMLDPSYEGAYYHRMLANYVLSRYDEAINDFRIVLKLNPNMPDKKEVLQGLSQATGKSESEILRQEKVYANGINAVSFDEGLVVFDTNKFIFAARESLAYQLFTQVHNYFSSSNAVKTVAPKNIGAMFDFGRWDRNVQTDPMTKEPLFIYRLFKQTQEVGSATFYGAKEFCRSVDGATHNIVATTGVVSEFPIDAALAQNICSVLPPTWQDRVHHYASSLQSSVAHGVLNGTLNSTSNALVETGKISQTTATIVALGIYLGLVALLESADSALDLLLVIMVMKTVVSLLELAGMESVAKNINRFGLLAYNVTKSENPAMLLAGLTVSAGAQLVTENTIGPMMHKMIAS